MDTPYGRLIEHRRFVAFVMLLAWCKPLALLLTVGYGKLSWPHGIDQGIASTGILFGGVFADWRWTSLLTALFFLYDVYLLDLLVSKKRLFIFHFYSATLLPTAVTLFWANQSTNYYYHDFTYLYMGMLLVQAVLCLTVYKSNLIRMTFKCW